MSKPTKPVQIAAIGVGLVYAAVLYLLGVELDSRIKQGLALLPAAAALLVLAFDLWLWKAPGIRRLAKRPRIDGAWLTTIRPNPKSAIPRGGNKGPITGAVIIEQNYWSISVRSLTLESRSRSTSAAFRQPGDSAKTWLLAYTYLNEPYQEHRPRSQPHVGASQFEMTGHQPTHMTGTYWTERLTAGDIELTWKTRNTGYVNLAAFLTEHGPPPQPNGTDG